MALIGDISRNRVQNFIKNGFVSLNGQTCTVCKTPVSANDKIYVDAPPPEAVVKAEAEAIPLDVMYEDQDLLVINKPAGMVVHPAAGNWSGTVVNALLDRDPELQDEEQMDPLRPGIVHRLDKDTSGALVIARNAKTLSKLSQAFAEREVSKTYLAVVHGWPVPQASVIRTFIGRHPTDRKRMAVARDDRHGAREAVTAYKVVRQGYWNGIKVAVLEVKLHTGRTHQIRVHMQHINFPLIGEKLYNKGRSSPAERQMLHAWKLSFTQPSSGETLEFEAPLPDDLKALIQSITPEKE